MSVVLDEKIQTQPTLSQRVGYVLVQIGDELEPLVLDYQSRYSHAMDDMAARLIKDMDKQTIEQLAAQIGKDEQTVKQAIGIAIQFIGWLHFPHLVKKLQWDMKLKPKVDITELFGCMNTGIDGLEYERKMREEVW